MNVIDDKSDKQLLESLLAEVAKAQSELRCAKADVDKASNRLKFALLVVNTMINRSED